MLPRSLGLSQLSLLLGCTVTLPSQLLKAFLFLRSSFVCIATAHHVNASAYRVFFVEVVIFFPAFILLCDAELFCPSVIWELFHLLWSRVLPYPGNSMQVERKREKYRNRFKSGKCSVLQSKFLEECGVNCHHWTKVPGFKRFSP